MCNYFISFVKEELLLCVFFPMDYEEQKLINWTVSRNKSCHLFDKSTPQKSDGKERYTLTVFMGWVWDRNNKESEMVPHLPRRQKRASENWAAKGCLEQYAIIPKGANRSKDRKRRKRTLIPDSSSQQDFQPQRRARRRLGQPTGHWTDGIMKVWLTGFSILSRCWKVRLLVAQCSLGLTVTKIPIALS